jgi:uncharacterized protein
MLTEHQKKVVSKVLAEEGAKRRQLVVTLSGGHAYGFPSPDSDFDLKGVHVEATMRVLALIPPKPSAERMEVVDGVEIDYTSNEIHGVLAGILSGNGNYAERVLGEHKLFDSAENISLAPLVERALSRKMHRHYHGFATSQMKEVEEKETVTAKKVLYVLRTALTGTHLMNTGRLVADVTELLDEYGFRDARELVEAKRAGEKTPLEPLVLLKWKNQLRRAFALLDEARDESALPEEAPNRAELEQWMIELRRRFW